MSNLLTTTPVASTLTFLEGWSNFFVGKLLGSTWTWDGKAVLNGSGSPEDTIKFLAFTLVMCHSLTYYTLNMFYTILSWIFTIEQLAPWRFQGTKKIERSLLVKVIAYTSLFHVVISWTTVKLWVPQMVKSNIMVTGPGQNLLATVPTLPKFVGQLLVCGLCTDFFFYWAHYLLHAFPIAYQQIHRVHHMLTVVVGWGCEFAHPFELLVGNIFPVLSGPLIFKFHPVVWFCWMIYAMYATVTGHSGFWYPSAIAGFHDLHHSSNRGNLGGTPIWDTLMGTLDNKWTQWQKNWKAGKTTTATATTTAATTAALPEEEAMKRLSVALGRTSTSTSFASPAAASPAFVTADDATTKRKRTSSSKKAAVATTTTTTTTTVQKRSTSSKKTKAPSASPKKRTASSSSSKSTKSRASSAKATTKRAKK